MAPLELQDLDPLWKRWNCKGYQYAYEIFDPPEAIQAQQGLLPTSSAKGPAKPIDSASPGSVPTSPGPRETQNLPVSSSTPTLGSSKDLPSSPAQPSSNNPPDGAVAPSQSAGDPVIDSSPVSTSLGFGVPDSINADSGNANLGHSDSADPGSDDSDPSPNQESGSKMGSDPSDSGTLNADSHSVGPQADSGDDPAELGPSGGVTIGGVPISLPPINPGALTAHNEGVVVDGSTLSIGATAVIDNTPISVLSDGVVAGTATYSFDSPGTASVGPFANEITVGSITFSPVSPQSTGVIVGGHTLTIGATTEIDHTPISIATDGLVLGSGSKSTITLHDPASQIAFGDATFSALPGAPGAFVLSGNTLSPGQTTEIAHTPVSVATDGLVVGDGSKSTIKFPSPTPALSFGDATFSAIPGIPGAVVISGNTLLPGQTTVLHQTFISVGDNGLQVIGATESFSLPWSLPATAGDAPQSGKATPIDGATASRGFSNSASTNEVSGNIVTSGVLSESIVASTSERDGSSTTGNSDKATATPNTPKKSSSAGSLRVSARFRLFISILNIIIIVLNVVF